MQSFQVQQQLPKRAGWTFSPPLDAASLTAAESRFSLSRGELATILLAEKLKADLVLLDERSGRRLAISRGLRTRGCVGILEAGFQRGEVRDLRQAYADLIAQRAYIDRRILNASLREFGLAQL